MDLVWELLELTIFETRCFCSSCRNYCLKRCRCFPMTTELACRKWWTFLTFFSGYLTRGFNFSYTGAIRRSDMLHRKWHERPIRSAWKTTEEEHHTGETEWFDAQKQRGRKLGQYKERMALRAKITVQTIKRHLDSGSRDLIQLRRDLREALSKASP